MIVENEQSDVDRDRKKSRKEERQKQCKDEVKNHTHYVLELLWSQGHGDEDFGFVFGGDVGFAGAEEDFVFDAGEGEFVAWKEGASEDALVVDTGSVGAAEVSDEEEAIGFGNDTVELGDAVVVDDDVAEAFFPPDDAEIACDRDGRPAVEWDEFCLHGCDF